MTGVQTCALPIYGILKVYNKIYAYGGVVGDVTGSLSGSYVLVTNVTSSNITSSTIVSSNNYLVNVTSSNISSSNIVTNTLTSSIILGTNITSSNISASGYISSSNVYIENTLVADTGSFIYFNINNSGSAPTNMTSSGMPGEIRIDNNFIYIYTRNRWVRSQISEWD